MTTRRDEDPCLACGACCASFRVDFDPAERDDAAGGFVPESLAEQLNGTVCRMAGTDRLPPRCVALVGAVGRSVRCGIYTQRPSPCREFEAGSDACTRARRTHGLAPLP